MINSTSYLESKRGLKNVIHVIQHCHCHYANAVRAHHAIFLDDSSYAFYFWTLCTSLYSKHMLTIFLEPGIKAHNP